MTKERGILGNRVFLYLTEFFAGMSVMAVELGASRLLAPYFSSSQIVWTIIIGTIMIAMALGNVYGGRSADRHPDPDRLYGRILIAAIWIAAIPVVGKYVIIGIAGVLIFSVSSNYLIVAAFAACMVVFVFPLFLLGTVTPSLAKYCMMQGRAREARGEGAGAAADGSSVREAASQDESGRTVGNLGAFNTIGSIIGTFVPTFISIPAVGTSVTFLIFAGILLALCVVYFLFRAGDVRGEETGVSGGDGKAQGDDGGVGAGRAQGDGQGVSGGQEGDGERSGEDHGRRSSARRLPTRVAVGIALYLLCCVFGHDASFAFWQEGLTYEGESVYNYLQVYEDEWQVVLSTNVLFGVQSVYRKEQELTGMYYDYAMAAAYMAGIREEAKSRDGLDILILGMGTGTYATQCARYFGNVRTVGVEIDDKITMLSRRYFALPEDVEVVSYDGRAYLNALASLGEYAPRYDVILVDAYQDITIPFQMSSVEFFTMVRDRLKDDGVMVVNMNMRSDRPGNITEYLQDTIASVFPYVATADVAGSTNRELYATTWPGMEERLAAGISHDLEALQAAQDGAGNVGADISVSDAGAASVAEGTDASAGTEGAVISAGDMGADESAGGGYVSASPDLSRMMGRVQERLVPYAGGGLVMTDDRAPVELLGMRMIDDLIGAEVAYYKDVYERDGIGALIEQL